MRARPGQKVTPQEQGAPPAPAGPPGQGRLGARATCGFRISSSTGRSSPSVRVDRVRDPRRGVVHPPADRAISGDRAADHQRLAASIRAPTPRWSPRPWSLRSRSRSTASRTCSTCRRTRPATGASRSRVTFDIGTNLDIAQVQVQNRVAHRAAAPAGRRAQHRRHRRQGLARPDDGRAPASRPTSRATRCSSPTTRRSRSRTR